MRVPVSTFSPDLKPVPAMLSSCGVAALGEEGDENETLNLLFNVLHLRREYSDLSESAEFE
jgi:hypothetical protein